MTLFWWILGAFVGTMLLISVTIGVLENRAVKGVCIQCGHLKRNLFRKCPRCKFVPSSDEEIAKQFILATLEHHVGDIFPGKPLGELRRISKRIEAGKAYNFNADELDEVLKNL